MLHSDEALPVYFCVYKHLTTIRRCIVSTFREGNISSATDLTIQVLLQAEENYNGEPQPARTTEFIRIRPWFVLTQISGV